MPTFRNVTLIGPPELARFKDREVEEIRMADLIAHVMRKHRSEF
ncbi:MAG: hypothetical protein U0R44_01100 [Candidatus Micrarchaeia archaeon]